VKTLRQIIPVLSLLLVSLRMEAQDFARIDSFARSVEWNRMSIRQLADTLTRPYHSDLARVRSIFVWIAHNIAYDYEKLGVETVDTTAWLTHPLFDDSLFEKNILERRRGICSDYARLFDEMCRYAGIESKIIEGFAKTTYKDIGVLRTRTNHAWNAVRLGGKWRLLDATWARRHFTQFSPKSIDEAYFLSPPGKLILDHLPEDDNWQLLDKKVDRQKFFSYPHVSSYYMKYDVAGFAPVNGLIPADGEEVVIKVKIARPDLVLRLVEGEQVLSDPIPVYENGIYKFRYSVTEETEGDKLSVGIRNEAGGFDIIMTYKLVD
jgi:transglutaminase/protease-like cytokinesis protein 3